MNKKTLAVLNREYPVIQRMISAYLAGNSKLSGVVIKGVSFEEVKPVSGVTKAKTNTFKADTVIPNGCRECIDKDGNIVIRCGNDPCPDEDDS